MNNLFKVLMYIVGGFVGGFTLILIVLGIYEGYMRLKEVKEDKRDDP